MENASPETAGSASTAARIPTLLEPAEMWKAIRVYLAQAYEGPPPVAVRSLLATLESWPGRFYDAVPFARGPSIPPERYTIRLGNRRYPHMKLVLEMSPDRRGYLLRADTHDRHVAPPKDSPEYAAFRVLMDENRAISEAIEAAWSAEGLPTFKTYLRDDLARRRGKI